MRRLDAFHFLWEVSVTDLPWSILNMEQDSLQDIWPLPWRVTGRYLTAKLSTGGIIHYMEERLRNISRKDLKTEIYNNGFRRAHSILALLSMIIGQYRQPSN